MSNKIKNIENIEHQNGYRKLSKVSTITPISLHTKTKFSYLLLLRYNVICSSHQFYIRDHYQQDNNIELKETNNNKEHDYTIET